ncbi:MAG TPA: polyamine aminopropyltransferase [Bacteroidetes bacterium]|nr:polyamine aminopropyltransferase [Bacteroidota bacterium]
MSSLGRHIIVEYYGCDGNILNDVAVIEKSMLDAAKAADATVINSTFHHFSPFGVSGVVVIQESHLAIHTWPEYGYAAVDIFTCGDSVDPWISYAFLEKAFQADYASAMEMLRGQNGVLQKGNFEPDEQGNRPGDKLPIQHNRNVWFTERNEHIAMSLRHKGDRLFAGQSDFQKVEVYDTYAYGRLLTLDGLVMTSENDEYVYHEMITHVAMQTHAKAERVLVIGGGDGGVVREILRYPQVEQVVMVEIDKMVVEASIEFLPEIAAEFDNPRLDLHIADGIDYVNKAEDASFDLVIVDSTDPIGPGEGLFTAEFYRSVHRILRPEGIMVTQSESPRFNTKVFQEIFACYRGIFGADRVHCYLAYIPTYPTGMWSFSFSTKSEVNPLQGFDAEVVDAFVEQHDLNYYNSDIHRAAFALPGYVRKLLK